MKRILTAVLCAAALLLTLAGCGPKSSTASDGNASGGNAYYASAGNGYASGGNASDGNAG